MEDSGPGRCVLNQNDHFVHFQLPILQYSSFQCIVIAWSIWVWNFQAEESAKVLKYLESEWLCVPWIDTNTSLVPILPSRAPCLRQRLRIHWLWEPCLKMPGKKSVCLWDWKSCLAFFKIKGMSLIWAQETGHIWWTFSVSGRGHKLTTTFVRQVNSGLDVRCWSWSVATSFALPYKSRVRLAAMELEVPKASQATPFFLRFEPSKAPRPWLHLSLFHQVMCVCFFLNSEETNSFWIRQLIIIPHPSLKKDANTQKIINESSMNHDIQWAFNCCNWGFYVCAFDPRTKFSPPKQDGQKMLVGPVQRRRCQRMEQIGWMDGKTGETNKNAMRCLES